MYKYIVCGLPTTREVDGGLSPLDKCPCCGGRLYPQETVRRFEEIRSKLKRQETAEFKPMVLRGVPSFHLYVLIGMICGLPFRLLTSTSTLYTCFIFSVVNTEVGSPAL